MVRRFISNYAARHQHRTNRLLHLVGVPLTFVVSLFFLAEERWGWGLLCFIAGYGLQFVGHAIEGNDAGEMVLIKKWLGRPYIDIVKRPTQDNTSNSSLKPLSR